MAGSRLMYLRTSLLIGFLFVSFCAFAAEPPFVSNVRAEQRTDGSKLLDVYYDVDDPDSSQLMISIRFSDNNGATYNIIPESLSGDVGLVVPGENKHVIWDAGKDMPGVFNTLFGVAVTADDHFIEDFTIPLPNLPQGAKPLEMVLIPAGSFTMGSPDSEQDRGSDEGPQHQVTISKSFYMGKYEVTQAQWEAVMGNNPSYFIGNPNNPVEQVSWNDCLEFISKLNQMDLGTFRLPTEAEWEYACRAGTTERFYWGDDPNYTQIEDYAWYGGNNIVNGAKEVGTKLPNPWNLFDMIGNVYEWCQDTYSGYSSTPEIDPVVTNSGNYRVLRGGVWNYSADSCRSADRGGNGPDYASYYFGFRLSRTQ